MRRLLYSTLFFCTVALSAPPAHAGSQPLQVEAAFRPLILRGYTRAATTATIAAEVSGRVTKLNYDVGDTIQNTALLHIDDTFITLDVENNAVALARNQVTQQQAQVRLDWLEKEFQRRQQLIEQQRISQSSFDDISQQRDQARLELRQQQLQHQQLQVEQSILQQQQQRHQPHAPAGWQVSQKHVEAGDLVQVGTPLMQVGNYQQLLVPLTVSADELNAIRAADGRGARIASHSVAYHLTTVSPAFDEKTRKIYIEVEIDNYSGTKRGGLPFTLALQLPDSGLMIPVAAVRNRYQHPEVQPLQAQQPIAIEVIDHVSNETGDWIHIKGDKRLGIGTELRASEEP